MANAILSKLKTLRQARDHVGILTMVPQVLDSKPDKGIVAFLELAMADSYLEVGNLEKAKNILENNLRVRDGSRFPDALATYAKLQRKLGNEALAEIYDTKVRLINEAAKNGTGKKPFGRRRGETPEAQIDPILARRISRISSAFSPRSLGVKSAPHRPHTSRNDGSNGGHEFLK